MSENARLMKELRDVKKDESTSGVTLEIVGENIRKMRGTICGPIDSPYEGGLFSVDITIPGRISAFLSAAYENQIIQALLGFLVFLFVGLYRRLPI